LRIMMGRRAVGILLAMLSPHLSVGAQVGATLAEMMSLIKAGTAENNFFDGGGEVIEAMKDDRDKVAACLLDKVGAIVDESGLSEFWEDLLVDASACCLQDIQCSSNVEQAYSLMKASHDKSIPADEAGAKIVPLLLSEV
ncbi:unnamed protein product, partial [Polarella glacialis]